MPEVLKQGMAQYTCLLLQPLVLKTNPGTKKLYIIPVDSEPTNSYSFVNIMDTYLLIHKHNVDGIN